MELLQAMIFVKDLERMSAFYQDGLGLRPLPEKTREGWAEFDAGGSVVALHAIPAQYAQNIVIASPPVAREDNPIKLVFRAADLSAARAQLVAHGAVMGEIRSWGTCDGLDPEGNVFQIASV
jgi:catechol 2,3-dioxygenase-like lactoylglutathione lyase family enzyme